MGHPPYAITFPARIPPPWWNPQNSGSGSVAGVVAVGATNIYDDIWDENPETKMGSSPGPVTWMSVPGYYDFQYPPGLTKPDVSAPGENITTIDYDGYWYGLSGTSLAAPHVAGTVCLMLSKNPGLTPEQIDSILEITAVELGHVVGKDNDFGAGRIDALAAVNAVTARPGDPDATYPNWGRKFAREPNSDNFHVVFTYGDTVFYSQSTNGGGKWSYPEPIGFGKYPAIILNQLPPVPWVVYLTPQGSIKRAIRLAPGVWDQAVVFSGSEQARAGAPALASDVIGTVEGMAHAVFPVYSGDPPTENFVYFCTYTSIHSVLNNCA